MQSTANKYVSSDALEQGISFPGDTRDQRGYLAWCSLWLTECRRALQDGAWAFVFTDWRQLPTMTDAVQAAGFMWRGVVSWHKPSHRRVRGGVSPACEFVVVGSNGPVRADGPQIEGFYSESAPMGRKRTHQTQKPEGVIAHLLKMADANSLILDPFAGSGTTGVAAISAGHRFLGIELSDHYHQVARARLVQACAAAEDVLVGEGCDSSNESEPT